MREEAGLPCSPLCDVLCSSWWVGDKLAQVLLCPDVHPLMQQHSPPLVWLHMCLFIREVAAARVEGSAVSSLRFFCHPWISFPPPLDSEAHVLAVSAPLAAELHGASQPPICVYLSVYMFSLGLPQEAAQLKAIGGAGLEGNSGSYRSTAAILGQGLRLDSGARFSILAAFGRTWILDGLQIGEQVPIVRGH